MTSQKIAVLGGIIALLITASAGVVFGTPFDSIFVRTDDTVSPSVKNPKARINSIVAPAPSESKEQPRDVLRAIDINPTDANRMQQSGVVDARVTVEPTLADINICKTAFVARRVRIDGIDFATRLAEILASVNGAPSETLTNRSNVCKTLGTAKPSIETVGQYRVAELPIYDVIPAGKESGNSVYYIDVSVLRFQVDVNANSVHVLGGFDGSPLYLGELK